MSQCYSKVPPVVMRERHAQPVSDTFTDNVTNNIVDLHIETIGYIGGPEHPMLMDKEDTLEMSSHILLGNVSTCNEFFQYDIGSSQAAAGATVHNLYTALTKNVDTYPALHAHLLADLKHIHGKQTKLIARGDAMLQLTSTPKSFPTRDGDNALKRHWSFLENAPPRKKKTNGLGSQL